MHWILIALITPVLHGFANILDNYLANRLFKNLWTLVFYSSFLNVIFLPFVFLIQSPGLPPLYLLPWFLLIGLIEVLYLFPYYKSLQTEDTSIITALFSLGRIFVPILAYLMVGEVLTFTQYLGFFIIILASAVATFNGKARLRFNASFFYMILCSVMLAGEGVIYKYLFENVSWSTGFVWPVIFSFLIALCFLFIPKSRRDIIGERKVFTKNLPVFATEEILTFAGTGAAVYAISLVPVTLAKSIGSFQPFVVLIYAMIFGRFFPKLFKEKVDRRSVVKKMIVFVIMICGVVLVVRGN